MKRPLPSYSPAADRDSSPFKDAGREFEFTTEDFRYLTEIIHKHTGIVLNETKDHMLYSRLAHRIRELQFANFADYCRYLQQGGMSEELRHLVNAVTTNITGFFREAHHFHHLREVLLLPQLGSNRAAMLPNDRPPRIRIWSAGCSYGMEPYSVALTAAELTLRESRATAETVEHDFKILATDIDTEVLAVAMTGEYAAREIGPIPAKYRRFLKRSGGKVSICESVKSMAVFKPLNLLEAWPMRGKFDAVFCRNVTIYFDRETNRRLFDRMAGVVTPGGWLYVGHAENLTHEHFELHERTIYRRRP